MPDACTSDRPLRWHRGKLISYEVSGDIQHDIPYVEHITSLRAAVAIAKEYAGMVPWQSCRVARRISLRQHNGTTEQSASMPESSRLTHFWEVLSDGSVHLDREFPMLPSGRQRQLVRQGLSLWLDAVPDYTAMRRGRAGAEEQLYALYRLAQCQGWYAASEALEGLLGGTRVPVDRRQEGW